MLERFPEKGGNRAMSPATRDLSRGRPHNNLKNGERTGLPRKPRLFPWVPALETEGAKRKTPHRRPEKSRKRRPERAVRLVLSKPPVFYRCVPFIVLSAAHRLLPLSALRASGVCHPLHFLQRSSPKQRIDEILNRPQKGLDPFFAWKGEIWNRAFRHSVSSLSRFPRPLQPVTFFREILEREDAWT